MRQKRPDGIRSVFVPEFANQGQEMSCHVLWDRAVSLDRCRIDLPQGLQLVHLYNVPASQVEAPTGSRVATIRGVQENGYIGFVLKSESLDRPDQSLEVRLAIALRSPSGKLDEDVLRAVRLIRPAVELVTVPKETHVSFPANAASPEVAGRLSVRNLGPGTAFIVIVPTKESAAELVDFFDAEEKANQLVEFLKTRFVALAPDYPAHADLLRTWTNYVSLLGEKELQRALKLIPELQRGVHQAARSDPLFVEDLGNIFDEAFRVTFTADMRFTGWIKGFDAMRDQRVVLLYPWAAFRLKKGETEFVGDLCVYDQLGNEQPTFEHLTLRLLSDADGLLPMYELISVVNPVDEDGGA